MNNKPGIGIIGLGGFGCFLLREWLKSDEVQIVAVSDENPSRTPPEAEHLKFYSDYREMLDNPDVNIVSIATPPSTHLSMALAAIEKGKHVLIEKPVALSQSDGKRIAEAAKRVGVVATANMMLRFDPLVEGMRKVIEAKVFGEPRRIDLRNYATQETVPPGHWFWNHDVSGGIIIEHGVHFFDMSSYMIGSRATRASGITQWRNPDQEDRVFAVVRFENDVLGTYWHSFSRPMPLETTTFHMAFDLGEVEISGWIPLTASFFGWTNEDGLAALRKHLPGLKVEIEKMDLATAESSDKRYPVSLSIKGSAEVQHPKLEVYGHLVREMISDVVAAINDPDHKLRITIEDAIAAVSVAEQATKSAQSSPMLPVP